MALNDIKKMSSLMIKIGQLINEDPRIIVQLEDFVVSLGKAPLPTDIDFEKINSIDLFQLIREKPISVVDNILSEFNVRELRELLKKYHLGSSSKLKTTTQIKTHIINQLEQRKTDVFHNV